ncbi:MAG: FAD-dependent oxidoreductase [Oscillospiraceae bacterium]|nr:FAD-dependent oxidoreductase [Oscillospiraceae bacterium]
MSYIRKLNHKLNKLFGGEVEAYFEDNCLVLTGELSYWNEVVAACLIALQENPVSGFVNDISCTEEKKMPYSKPRLEDSFLEFEEPDVLIIGGGVVGCAAARELCKYDLNILLIEKEHDLAMQATGHCGGFIQSGIGVKKDTARHRYIHEGGKMFDALCTELGVVYNRCGQYFYYTNQLWRPFVWLSKLYWRWHGIKEIEIISGEELRRRLPGISPSIACALFLPDCGVLCPHFLTAALAENAVSNGVVIAFNTIVKSIKSEDGVIQSVTTNRGVIHPKIVINAAGAFCEDIAKMAGDRFYSARPAKSTSVLARAGNFSNWGTEPPHGGSAHGGGLTRSVVSAYANSFNMGKFSGMANASGAGKRRSKSGICSILPTAHGSFLIESDNVETINKEDFTTAPYFTDRAVSRGKHVFPALDGKDIFTYFSGIRAFVYGGDFIVGLGKSVSNIIHAAGLGDGGLTASPAIASDAAKMVLSLLSEREDGFIVRENSNFNPVRKAPPTPYNLSLQERSSLIEENPDYGIIVCRCRGISKGEIIEALNRPVKCETTDGLKRRIGIGMGCCQGSFCAPIVHDILAAEKSLSLRHIRKNGGGSAIVYGSLNEFAKRKFDTMLSIRDDNDGEANEYEARLRELAVAKIQESLLRDSGSAVTHNKAVIKSIPRAEHGCGASEPSAHG